MPVYNILLNVLPEIIQIKSTKQKNPNLFVAEIKQLPPTEPVKDAPAAKEDGDSVVNKNNTKDENLKFTSVYQETEEAARLENVQEEMPSKAGNGKYYDYTDINGYHEASIPYL